VRVLICDDEPDIRFLYRSAFERAGADVDEAANGDECLAVADANEPDIVVLDLLMPGRDGLATLPALRRDHPHARVLIVSAHAAVDVFEASRSRGAAACFDKIGFLPRIPWVVERFGGALEH
jgi:CheY-like chemotaxis protein